MPGPALFPLLATAAPGLWQAFSGIRQANKAKDVRLQDTRPASFLEEVSLRRQQAGSQLFPGQKNAESQIQQNMANSASALAQSGTGSSGILAGLSRLGQQANQSTNQLATQAAAYQDQSRDKLVGALRQDAAYRTNDLNNYNRERAALKQASAENLFGGLSTLGTVGAYAASGGFDKPEAEGGNALKVGQDTLGNYGAGGMFDPSQQMQLGLGNLYYPRGGKVGRWW